MAHALVVRGILEFSRWPALCLVVNHLKLLYDVIYEVDSLGDNEDVEEIDGVGLEGGGLGDFVEDNDLRKMGEKAAWSVNSCKAGNGVSSLRDDNLILIGSLCFNSRFLS
ncbi:hypothetical protein ACE6H2_016348 [Prunus campanulata]